MTDHLGHLDMPATLATHRIPGCDGRWHYDSVCETVLADLATPGATLVASVSAEDDGTFQLVVWEGNDGRDLIRTHNPAEATEFADRLRALAAAVDKGAALLPAADCQADTLIAHDSDPDMDESLRRVRQAKPSAVDYAARFAALDSDVLFGLEDTGDCDTAQRHVESLLIVLAEWRPRVVAMLADAPQWAVPEAAAYRRALDRVREALVQWEFRYDGGPDLPYPFDLPEPAPKGYPQTVTPVARITSAGRRDLTVRGVAA